MRRSSFQPVRSPFSSEKVIMMTSTVAHPSVYSSAHLLLFLVRLQLLVSGCMDVFKGPLARHAESRTCGLNERRTGLPKPNNQGTFLLTDATPATAASFGKSSSWSLALIWIWFLTTKEDYCTTCITVMGNITCKWLQECSMLQFHTERPILITQEG